MQSSVFLPRVAASDDRAATMGSSCSSSRRVRSAFAVGRAGGGRRAWRPSRRRSRNRSVMACLAAACLPMALGLVAACSPLVAGLRLAARSLPVACLPVEDRAAASVVAVAAGLARLCARNKGPPSTATDKARSTDSRSRNTTHYGDSDRHRPARTRRSPRRGCTRPQRHPPSSATSSASDAPLRV